MRRCVKRSVTHVLHEDTTTIPSVRTTRRSSKRQRVAQASSEDSALTSSILVPHNGDKAAVDATTRQQDVEAAEKAVVTALFRSTCPQEPMVSAGRPRRLSARRTKYELMGGGGHQDRVGRGAALPSSMRHSHRRQRCEPCPGGGSSREPGAVEAHSPLQAGIQAGVQAQVQGAPNKLHVVQPRPPGDGGLRHERDPTGHQAWVEVQIIGTSHRPPPCPTVLLWSSADKQDKSR
eukprot:jgi/Picre1/28344/NNA_003750.t1